MKQLVEYILEAAFQSSEWTKHDYKYAKNVIYDLINNNPVYIANNGKKTDLVIDVNDSVIKALKKLCINPEVNNANDLKLKNNVSVEDFNAAFSNNLVTAPKNTWTKIFKGTYSKSIHSGEGGMEFEQNLCKGLQECFMNGNSNYDYANVLYSKLIKQKPKTFKKIAQLLKNDSSLSIEDFIFVSGKGATARNANNQIINIDTFEVNLDKKTNIDSRAENKVEDVLEQSGKIIADITITPDGKNFNKSDIETINPDDIYISCKDGYSQFSSISMQAPFYGSSKKTNVNSDITDSYKTGDTYEEYIKKNSPNVEAFKNLCKFMAIDPKEVYDYFSLPENKRYKELKLKTIPGVNGNIIGTLIHLIIGGNYWYANSKHEPVFIGCDIDDSEFLFEPDDICRLNPKQIVLTGHFVNAKIPENDARVEIKFRSSDSSYTYPYRLFVVPKDKDLINRLYN